MLTAEEEFDSLASSLGGAGAGASAGAGAGDLSRASRGGAISESDSIVRRALGK